MVGLDVAMSGQARDDVVTPQAMQLRRPETNSRLLPGARGSE